MKFLVGLGFMIGVAATALTFVIGEQVGRKTLVTRIAVVDAREDVEGIARIAPPLMICTIDSIEDKLNGWQISGPNAREILQAFIPKGIKGTVKCKLSNS